MGFTLESTRIACPYCGEAFEVLVDPSVSEQDYVEDCYVCCRPIEFAVTVADGSGEFAVLVRRDDEA